MHFRWSLHSIGKRHDLTAEESGALAGLDVGSTWVFPPTVLLQYHFTNFGAFQPYVGVGVNFTAYPWSKGGNSFSALWTPLLGIPGSGLVASNGLKVSSSWGVAGQVGFDYMLNQNWGINLDLKRILMQPTAHATVWNSAVSPILGPIPVLTFIHISGPTRPY